MNLVNGVIREKEINTLKQTMNVLTEKLKEAIEDVEQGRIISEDDLWEEIMKLHEAEDAVRDGEGWLSLDELKTAMDDCSNGAVAKKE